MPHFQNKRPVFHVVTSNCVQRYRNGLHKNDHRGGAHNPVCPFWDQCRLELRFNETYGNWKVYKPENCGYPTWNKIRKWADDTMREMDENYKQFLMEKAKQHDFFIPQKSKNRISSLMKQYYDFIDERNRQQENAEPIPDITPPDTPIESLCGTPPTATEEIITNFGRAPKLYPNPHYSEEKEERVLAQSWADMDDDDDDDLPPLPFKELLTQSAPAIFNSTE